MSLVSYKRIAQNATALYLRMIVTMVLGLYTSRVVLQMLGVSDFGIFGLVAGIAGMLSIINTSMAGATSRYITYELAKGDKERLSQTFTSALQIHIGIAAFSCCWPKLSDYGLSILNLSFRPSEWMLHNGSTSALFLPQY